MEALADFGTVNLLSFQRPHSAIYRVWYGASTRRRLQLATVLVALRSADRPRQSLARPAPATTRPSAAATRSCHGACAALAGWLATPGPVACCSSLSSATGTPGCVAWAVEHRR